MGQPYPESHMSSIWDAEETCDVFLFKKDYILHKDSPCLSPVASVVSKKKVSAESGFEKLDELSPDEERLVDDLIQRDPITIDSCDSDSDIRNHLEKGISALADMYWPDSLGPLDLDTPSTKYHTEDLIFSDSLGGLNRLIASSLDAFQNCSFFGFDKKEAPSTVEARESAVLSNFKIESGI